MIPIRKTRIRPMASTYGSVVSAFQFGHHYHSYSPCFCLMTAINGSSPFRSSPFLLRGRGLNERVVCLMPGSHAASNQTGLDDPPVPPSALKDHERHIAPLVFKSSADGFRPPSVSRHRCRSRGSRAVPGKQFAGAGGFATTGSACCTTRSPAALRVREN